MLAVTPVLLVVLGLGFALMGAKMLLRDTQKKRAGENGSVDVAVGWIFLIFGIAFASLTYLFKNW